MRLREPRVGHGRLATCHSRRRRHQYAGQRVEELRLANRLRQVGAEQFFVVAEIAWSE